MGSTFDDYVVKIRFFTLLLASGGLMRSGVVCLNNKLGVVIVEGIRPVRKFIVHVISCSEPNLKVIFRTLAVNPVNYKFQL